MLPCSRIFRLSVFGLSLALLAAFAPRIHAQTAHFSGAVTALGSGFNLPEGVAVDGSGNVYVADYGNNEVKEMPAGCASSACVATVGGGFSGPGGVAVDGSGNVYVADYHAVKEMPAGCTSSACVTTLGGGFYAPESVAVDRSGNVYVADSENNAVKEIPVGCTSSACVTTVDSGVSDPSGVAVDGSGNLYIADTGDSAVEEIPASCIGSVYACAIVTLGGGFDQPNGVAVDGSGNVYVSDGGKRDHAVREMPAGCGSSSCVTTLGDGFNLPIGVAVDGSDNVYVADTLNNAVKEIMLGGVNFYSEPVGGASAVQTLTFTFDSSGSIAAPAVLTQGTPNLDFTDHGTGTCTSNGASQVYAQGDTCTVDVVFSPKYAGTRDGAVELTSSTGAVIATAYVYGTGTGPQIGFLPPAQSTIVPTSSFHIPDFVHGVAVDSAGNVYIAVVDRQVDTSHVLKETLSGGAYTQSTIAPGLASATGVAVDGAGNVYVAVATGIASTASGVLKETLSGGSYVQSALFSGLQAYGIAVDGAGNIYITDAYSGSVLKETFSGGAYTQSTIASGLDGPIGVAVDSAGNVYVVENGSGIVVKETLSGGAYTQSTIASGLRAPVGVAVDSAANVYIADLLNGRVLKETPTAGGYTQSTIASDLDLPETLAVDSAGNLYITLYNGIVDSVLKEDLVTPPSLSFAETLVGTESSDSPKFFTMVNNGNADLTLAVPGAGEFNPSISAGFTIDSGSTCPQLDGSSSGFTLAAGASCNYGIDFRPVTGGMIAGSAVMTDNNLNASSSTQKVGLSGTAFTPAEYIDGVMAGQVTALGLNGGQTNSLTKELNQAAKMFNQGKTSGAINNLEDFIAEVNDLESSGNLTSQQETGLATLEGEANTLIQDQ